MKIVGRLSTDSRQLLDRRRALLARMESCGTNDPEELAVLLHRSIDAGLAEPVLGLAGASGADHDIERLAGSSPSLAWAVTRALWGNDRWDEVTDLARMLVRRDEVLQHVEHARIVIRATWVRLLRGDREVLSDNTLELLRARTLAQQGPAAVLADLAHLDAYDALVHAGEIERASRRSGLAASVYNFLGEPHNEGKARVLAARTHMIAGQLDASAQHAGQAVRGAEDAGDPHLLVLALGARGTVDFRRGEWGEAERDLSDALLIAKEFGDRRWALIAQANLARLHALRGDSTRARAILGDISDSTRRACHTDALMDEYRGVIELASGNASRAIEHFESCLQRLDSLGIRCYERPEARLRRAEALVVLERFSEAYDETARGLDELDRLGSRLERGHLLRVRGCAARGLGRPREALKLLSEAESELRQCGDRFELARCLLDAAQPSDRDAETRASSGAEASDLFDRLGCAGWSELARGAKVCAEADVRRSQQESVWSESSVNFVPGIIAESLAMRELMREAATAGSTLAPVLLQGETGTGKEVVARFVHLNSERADGPFVPVNCAAIPESLFEREFFGHARGSFTGADRDVPGLVQSADGGTLFLDEVGEMPLSLQPKILRLLQEGTYRRVGEAQERTVDLRIVAATNRSLFELSQRGEFREDLYYRLSWFELHLQPLRDRPEDLVALANHFLAREGQRQEMVFWIEKDAWRLLKEHPWPGNARQLESAIASACARSGADGCLRPEDLPAHLRLRSQEALRPVGDGLELGVAMRRYERELILQALRRCDQHRARAARALGIGRNTLYDKMKKLGIRPESVR